MAPSGPKKEERLASWKEIAAYLGCDERTCLRWEKKLGLPVHRMEGASKSRVFAYREELDRWMRERITLANVPTPLLQPRLFLRKSHRVFVAIAALVGVAIAAIWIGSRTGSIPSNFRIEDSTFFALNKKGRTLWSYNTGLFNLRDESFYRDRFQIKVRAKTEDALFPLLLMKDINGDGRAEVLFALKTQDEFNEGRILCFNDRGKLLWDFAAGRELLYGDAIYARDYRVAGIGLHDFDGDGLPKIFFFAYQKPDFPCQLGVLNAKGELIGEYWNSGFFSDIVFLDIDGDGRDEVLAAGLNNEYGKGCLVAFAPDRISGSSPQRNPAFLCRDLAPGSELFYVLFPRTDVDLAEYPVECIMTIDILRNHRIYLNALLSRIFFEMTPAMELVLVHSSHSFQKMHAEAVRAGKVRSSLEPAYFERLRRGVLYWNGTDWVSTRTPNLRNAKTGTPLVPIK